MIHKAIAVIGACLAIGACPAKAATYTLSTSTNSLNYEEILRCGPNALFMFLVLCGHLDIRFEQLNDEVHISSEGASLLALRDVAAKFGVDAEVRYYRPDEVASVSLPAIGHFNRSMSSPSLSRHHFDIIYKIDAERMYLLNGTTGEKEYIRRSKVPEWWTGFAMVEKRTLGIRAISNWGPKLLAGCLIIADVSLLTFWFRSVKWRRRRTKLMTEAGVVA